MSVLRLDVPDEPERNTAVTAVLPGHPADVEEATDDDLRVAVREALARCGLTFDELAEQARTGSFDTVAARLAWVAIGDLGHLAG